DVLLGGSASGSGDDLLIGGKLSYYNESSNVVTTAALDDIMREWTSTGTGYANRINHLMNGGGLNGSSRVNSSTVAGDSSAKDTLTGGGGNDWFVVGAEDVLTDKATGETKTVI